MEGAMHTTTHKIAFFLLLIFVTYAFVWLLMPYYGSILWAVILAILFRPLQRRLEDRFGEGSNIAAIITLLLFIFLVLIPAAMIISSLVNEGTSLYQQLRTSGIDLREFVTNIRAAVPSSVMVWLDRLNLGDFDALRDRLTSVLMQGSQIIASRVLSVGQDTLQFFVSLGLMLYLLFFLFRDGSALARTIRRTIPLNDAYSGALIDKFAAVVRATVKGNMIIAAVQGAIGGVAFWLLGIKAALLWGVLMAFLSMLPAIGAAFVWLPAAIYFLVTGDYFKGTVLMFIGLAVIGLIDNLLRPPLVGKDTQLPDYAVLLSTVGGIALFGINGFVIGPLIAAAFIAVWTLLTAEREAQALRMKGGHHPH